MSSNLHRNSTEANKHTPKGFDLADNNSTLLRDERGQSRYIDNLVNERVENLVDGFNAPPTTTSGHLYVLIDEGSGTVNTDWNGANYNDIVRIQDGVWVAITPVNGYLVFNKTDEKYYKFGSTGWQKLINIVEDTTPQLGGDLDLNGNDINGTGNVDVTGNVIADIVQLRGGVGTQGEMSWSTDEETVKLIMDGTTLYMGQDTFVHVRNNTASIITKGTAVYATGTLGASGRITVAPMIADGTIPGRLFIGLAAEDIAIGADGQVCSYGKIRGINTTAYNDGDVLWISPTVAGQLTATEPTAPNLKIATAFVIHDATNGTLMVRAEQGTDLHSDQRVQVSSLTNNDVLTWNNVNQRWQNSQPVLPNWGSIGGTLSAQTDLQTALNLKLNIADAYGGKRYTLIKPNGTKEFYETLTQVRSNWADGDVLHQFADETDITYVDNGSGYMFTLPSIAWNGNGFQVKVSNILTSGEAYVLLVGKTAYLSNLRLGGQGANVSSVALINGTLYCDDNTFISIDIENNKSSSLCLNLAGTMYGGNVIANGDGEAATLPQGGIGGAGTCINVNTRGFQSGSLSNFFGGSTTYSVATNYRNVYCNFGNQQIGNGKTFDHSYIYSTRNNNGANQSVFVARNCTIIHMPTSNTHTFYNIANITMIDCVFISAGYLCASFGSTGPNIIQGGYHSFANQTNYGAHNYSSLLTIIDCTIEATNASATTDVLLLNNSNATNVKINNVTFKNASGRSDIRTIPANNVEWKNCRFSKGSSHISVSSGTVADAINNNPARLTDPKGFLNNTGNGNWFMYVPMTTAERDLLTSVSAGFVIRNTTTNFLQVYNGSTWKDLLNLT